MSCKPSVNPHSAPPQVQRFPSHLYPFKYLLCRVSVCYSADVEARGQFVGDQFFLLPCRSVLMCFCSSDKRSDQKQCEERVCLSLQVAVHRQRKPGQEHKTGREHGGTPLTDLLSSGLLRYLSDEAQDHLPSMALPHNRLGPPVSISTYEKTSQIWPVSQGNSAAEVSSSQVTLGLCQVDN